MDERVDGQFTTLKNNFLFSLAMNSPRWKLSEGLASSYKLQSEQDKHKEPVIGSVFCLVAPYATGSLVVVNSSDIYGHV